MSMASDMQVTLGLPTRTLYQGAARALVAEAENGAFGLLPNHLDFVTALVPSVLVLTEPGGRERFFGIDEGLLVKQGHQVNVAVRRGAEGRDLASLRHTVADIFGAMDEDERVARAALSRLEASIVRRFAELRKPAP
ncbi:ATPase [Marinobacter halodurans]|uniref:ATP synthase epsilon chain n=1 Tax=Marinobacter halodurans TaxID=2528979 RepID=A0ABY1ZNM5_9GAMM|nr:ATPase [Marinobacter halodurans]TBW55484.1 ATPase [Marinobacter halodurans]